MSRRSCSISESNFLREQEKGGRGLPPFVIFPSESAGYGAVYCTWLEYGLSTPTQIPNLVPHRWRDECRCRQRILHLSLWGIYARDRYLHPGLTCPFRSLVDRYRRNRSLRCPARNLSLTLPFIS